MVRQRLPWMPHQWQLWAHFVILMATLLLCSQAYAVRALTPSSLLVQADGEKQNAMPQKLPFHWDAHQRGKAGHATVTFNLAPTTVAAPQALFLARVGNTYRVSLDGRLLISEGNPSDPHEDYGKLTRVIILPVIAKTDAGVLTIDIAAQASRKAGVGQVLIGSVDEITAIQSRSTFARWNLSIVIVTISAAFGSLSLLLWHRQRESIFLVYGAGELLFALHASDTLFHVTPLPWPWWGALTYSAHALAWLLCLKFAMMIVGLSSTRMKTLMYSAMVSVVIILVLSVFGAMPALELVVMAIVQMIALIVAIAVARAGLRAQEIEKKVIAIASLGLLLVLARDAFVLLIRPYSGLFSDWGSHYGEMPWSRFGWLAFSVAMAWTLSEKLRRDGVALKQANVEMWRRLALQRIELKHGFTGQLEEVQKQGQLDERHRLMRDMHDGLGSHLLGALQLARDPTSNRARITEQLEATLDLLKLTVDAMQDVEGDIGSLLGALRYRLGPRLEAGGIQLSWLVQELPCIGDWSVDDSRDLQMILYEGISNIILHSSATHVTIAAHHEASSELVVLRLIDNGCGFVVGRQPLDGSHQNFSPSGAQAESASTTYDDQIAAAAVSRPASGPQRRGRGLTNIDLRARRLGALLRMQSNSSGTTLELSLAPRVRHQPL